MTHDPDDQSWLAAATAQVPDGWYRVPAEGAAAAVRTLVLGGREIVLWATDDGVPVAQDAHCPHFGAHLAHGGEVDVSCLRCPFHGWRFAADGRHVGFPDAEGTTSARLATLPTRVVDDGTLVWSGPEGAPVWEPPSLTASIPSTAQQLGVIDATGEGLHLAMMEGIVDAAHFPVLHGVTMEISDLDFASEPQARVRFTLDSGATADITFDGLSRVVERMDHGDYTLWMVGEYWLHSAATASGRVRFWGDGPRPAGVERLYRTFRRVYEAQALEDQHIWRHRRYGAAQAYGPGDRPVIAFRRWARQFFREAAK